jgi:dihydrofolate reductase
MKVILIDVSSVNGKLTKGTDTNVYDWSSPEDLAHFQKVKSENNLLIMGSGTFEKVKDIENAGLKPEADKLRIVLTSNPEKYKEFEVKGQLEFSEEKPEELIKRLEENGYKQILLVSGGKVATSFFEGKLIDEIWITIEPYIFGTGEPMVQEKDFNIKLQLLSYERLNNQGTLLLKYKVIKE